MKESISFLFKVGPATLAIIAIILSTLSIKYPNSEMLSIIIISLVGVGVLLNGIKDLKKDKVKSGKFSIIAGVLVLCEVIFKIIWLFK